MRFIENGPSIPDDLLIARDKGNVVFFCGAGVSIHYAKLLSFEVLYEKVTLNLHAEIDKIPKDISLDQKFGRLSTEFSKVDLYRELAKILLSSDNIEQENLRAHNSLLTLSTNQLGQVRLVTTNFDNLFSLASPSIKTFYNPTLPNIQNTNDFNGIVYLHGKLNNESEESLEQSSLVLTSSEFGEAYLAHGWATNFIKDLFENYTVVFVGYSAEDPLMRYLLEALSSSPKNKLYAFDCGTENDVTNNWKIKGVNGIAFDEYEDLWLTLEKWAEKETDPNKWNNKIIEIASTDPALLQPFEREQVAYFISTEEGAQAFANSKIVPDAAWINVFDHLLRAENLEKYGLERDDNFKNKKLVQDKNTWDAFKLNDNELINIREPQLIPFKNNEFVRHKLSMRLNHLMKWILKVIDKDEIIYWLAKQNYIHPIFLSSIKNELVSNERKIDLKRVKLINCILESYKHVCFINEFNDVFLKKEILLYGWSKSTIQKFIEINKPYIHVYTYDIENDINIEDKIKCEVLFPNEFNKFDIPDEYLECVFKQLVSNLYYAYDLYLFLESTKIYFIKSSKHNVLNYLIQCKCCIKKLASINVEYLTNKINDWPTNNILFNKLKDLLLEDKDFIEAYPNIADNLRAQLSSEQLEEIQMRTINIEVTSTYRSLNKNCDSLLSFPTKEIIEKARCLKSENLENAAFLGLCERNSKMAFQVLIDWQQDYAIEEWGDFVTVKDLDIALIKDVLDFFTKQSIDFIFENLNSIDTFMVGNRNKILSLNSNILICFLDKLNLCLLQNACNEKSKVTIIKMLVSNINELFDMDKNWVINNILSLLKLEFVKDVVWDNIINIGMPNKELFQALKLDLLKILEGDKTYTPYKFAYLIFSKWVDNDKECFISDNELRTILIKTNNKFRICFLSCFQYEGFIASNQGAIFFKKLIKDIWPKHLKAKDKDIYGSFVELIVSSQNQFPEIINDAIKFLAGFQDKVYDFRWLGYYQTIDNYPKETLLLLNHVLIENMDIYYYPLDLEESLLSLIDKDQSLENNSDLIELKSKLPNYKI